MQHKERINSILKTSSPLEGDLPLIKQTQQVNQQVIFIAQNLLCDAFWDWSENTQGKHTQFFCDGLRKMLGYSKKELPNDVRSWKKIIHPEDFNKTPLLTSPYDKKNSTTKRLELRLKHKKGHDIWVLSQYQKIPDDSKNTNRIIGKFIDITPHINLNDNCNLTSRLQELETTNKNLKQFNEIAAHEIRGPIASLGMTIDYIQNRYSDTLDEKALSLLSKAETQARDALKFLEEILVASKRNKEEPLEKMKFRLYDLIEKAKNEVLFLFPNYQVINRIDPHTLVSVSGIGIEHLLRNLITNAIKYRSKERKLQITIVSKIKGDKCLVEICDNGIGAKKSQLEKIFIRRHRLQQTENIEGHGIGLAFCQEIVERHGGTISASQNHKTGLTISFTLPLAQVTQVPSLMPHAG